MTASPADTLLSPSATAIAMLAATVAYLTYHLGQGLGARWQIPRGWWRRVWGIPWLLGLPLALGASLDLPSPGSLGLNLEGVPRSLGLTGLALALTLPALWLASRKPDFRTHYPEVRRAPWTPRDRALNALTWAAYLLAYEYFFRGFLLLHLAEVMEPALALALVTMAYAFAHIDKHGGELVGTVFSGLIFGTGALLTGSLLMPWLAHLIVAVTADTLGATRSRSATAQ